MDRLSRQLKSFPPVFWVANIIEVLERFSYYGIYFGFGIYLTSKGFSRDDLGIIQSLFLVVSYTVLAMVFYLVLTPIGLLMRLVGYDPMSRRFDKDAASYWVPREGSRKVGRYFRQF